VKSVSNNQLSVVGRKAVLRSQLSVRSWESEDCRAALARTCSRLSFTTGGSNGGWYEDGWSYYDGDCLVTSTPEGGQDWLQTTVTGPGTIKFWWRVSTDSYEGLEFYIDGQLQDTIGGEQMTWAQKTFNESGGHTYKRIWGSHLHISHLASDASCGGRVVRCPFGNRTHA